MFFITFFANEGMQRRSAAFAAPYPGHIVPVELANHGGQIIWSRGFGQANAEAGRPATATTPFHLASLTKPFGSIILMQLVEQGLVDLDDPVSDYGVDLSSNDLFKGKTVVVFSLPGAFTPTCSSTHVPRYNQLTPVLKQHGVDEVICVSVNDAFVMNEWQKEQKAFNLTFLPDGNGDFSRGMGMLVPKNDLGFGDRSWRYSMLVKDGVIEKMFIEPDVPGDPAAQGRGGRQAARQDRGQSSKQGQPRPVDQ